MALFIATAYDLLKDGHYKTFWDLGYRPYIRHHIYDAMDKTPEEVWARYDRRFDSELSFDHASFDEIGGRLDDWMMRSRIKIKQSPKHVGFVKIKSSILMLPYYVGWTLIDGEIISQP